jgi:hypothetical protein
VNLNGEQTRYFPANQKSMRQLHGDFTLLPIIS